MFSHKMILDTKLTLLDKDCNPIREIELPKKETVPDDFVDLLLRDGEGYVVQKETMPFSTFTRNFMIGLDAAFSGQTQAAPRDTAGTVQNSGVGNGGLYNSLFVCQPNPADATYGIVVGSGSTFMSSSDWKLSWQYPHANPNKANQLNYQGYSNMEPIVSSGSLRRLTLRRTFLNAHTQSQIVRECGLITYGSVQMGTKYLIARDTFQYDGTPISMSIAPNQTLEVAYNFYIDTDQGFVDNFLRLLWGNMMWLSAAPVVPITGIVSTINMQQSPGNAYFYTINAGVGQRPGGICVGKGSSMQTQYDTYNMESMIDHGSGSGQLIYSASVFQPHITSSVSQSMSSSCNRRFWNNSGATITVKEIGIYAAGNSAATFQTSTNILIARKLVGSVDVAHGERLEVAFIFGISSSIVTTP